ncbi:hypothetical protein GCM10017083_15810 [Thalassobaculum fulvum]|uniref:Uncharacterized protein n=2 Tax=Thalassobaculum fulvum TaxID=1633335 RepID=A0A918XQM3_9PROT|nr:hypothetical protein GCM10017083_15810 [Thalassobaculum fulvum]
MQRTQGGCVPAALVRCVPLPYMPASRSDHRPEEATMSPVVSRLGVAETPAASVTLAQTEILAPVVLALANALIAGIALVGRLFRRG